MDYTIIIIINILQLLLPTVITISFPKKIKRVNIVKLHLLTSFLLHGGGLRWMYLFFILYCLFYFFLIVANGFEKSQQDF